jgi:serine/threonine protein kinase
MPELAERLQGLATSPFIPTASGPCLTVDELHGVAAARLATQEGIRLAEHVAFCPTCRQAVQEARATLSRRADPAPRAPRVPGHRVEELIGRGGFGSVWRGVHEGLGQPRAFKVLPGRHLPAGAREMQRREARLMAELPVEPRRVQVHDLVESEGDVVVVMGYVAGGPLGARAPLGWEAAVRYTVDACLGLEGLHRRGVLHRDIKPSNLLHDRDRDLAVLADYGLAAFVDEQASLAGTAGYLAPELLDRPASVKSDVFALAATLHALLTGASPFASGDPYTGLLLARRGLPTGALAGMPEGVRELVAWGLELEPGDRPDLAAFLARLRLVHVRELALALQRRASAARGARLRVTLSVARDVHDEFQVRLRRSSQEGGTQPARLEVPAGQLLQIEADADERGYLTVLNFDTAGTVDVLVPGPLGQNNVMQPGRPHRLQVQLTPSPGGDHAAIIWTRRPALGSADEWRRRILSGPIVPPTRGLVPLTHENDADEWAAVLVDVVQPG